MTRIDPKHLSKGVYAPKPALTQQTMKGPPT